MFRSTTSLVFVALLLAPGCAPAYEPPPRRPRPAMDVSAAPVVPSTQGSANPLSGTEWKVVSVMGTSPARAGVRVTFGTDGSMSISSMDPAGVRDARSYTVDGTKLTMVDAMGTEHVAGYSRFGDELRIDGPQARVVLEQLSGSEDISGPIVVNERVSRTPDDPDHPIRGTRWKLLQALGNVPVGFESGTFVFQEDGWLMVTLDRRARGSNEVRRHYRVDSKTLYLIDNLGITIPCEMEYTPRRLVLDLPKARVVLAPE